MSASVSNTYASKHLPECPVAKRRGTVNPSDCICDRLRACELRVLRKEYELDEGDPYREVYRGGYAAGLDAAEAAVAAKHWTHRTNESWVIAYEIGNLDAPDDAIMLRSDALDAIRALKEKP